MQANLSEKIARVQALLTEIHFVPIATVDDDGSPRNSPVLMAFSDELLAYWPSHPESTHSQNIARDPRVFMVVYDSRQGGSGLYLQATAEAISDQSQATRAYEIVNRVYEPLYGDLGGAQRFIGESPQRLYRATLQKAWIARAERDETGRIVRDHRYEVPLEALRQV